MSGYIRDQADKHKVKHIHSGKLHFFEVTSGNSGKVYNVSIKINCDCDNSGMIGQARGTMCSHVLAVLREVINRGDISISHEENIQEKRNCCKQLVRPSNRHLNQIRDGKNEGAKHKFKKKEICFELDKKGIHYYTECIIDSVGLRIDILNLDNFEAIEVVDTESNESIERKRAKCKEVGLKLTVVNV